MKSPDLNSILNEFASFPNSKVEYNTFAAWGMSENDHTKLLVAILRYNDANGTYPVLRSFLSRFAKSPVRCGFKEIKNVKVKFNHGCASEGGFIDGLITFTHATLDYAVVIENKIYDAPDQKDQVRRYISEAKNILKTDKATVLDRIWVFYITRDGSKVIDDTSYNLENEKIEIDIGERFVPISYKDDIISWLKDEVLGKTNYPKSLTDVAKIYLEHLENELINNSYMSEKKAWLLEQMGIAADLRDITKQQLTELYSLRKEIQNNRKLNSLDQESLNSINIILSDILRDLEELAFGRFESLTKEILDEWTKDQGLKWMIAHRGLRDDGKGYLQIRLVNDWRSAHMEWDPISVFDMLFGNQYHIALHLEGHKELRKVWSDELKKNKKLLPKNGKIATSSRLFKWSIMTDMPFSIMEDSELKETLKRLYTEECNFMFLILIQRLSEYKNNM